ncbi:hypothetical protein ACFL4O_02140, partial [bacterium]
MSYTFLKNHFILFSFAVFLGVYMTFLIPKMNIYIIKYKSLFESQTVKFIFLLICLLFLTFGYFAKPAYYNPKTIGTLGDDYKHLASAMKKEGYVKGHHP